MALNQQLIRPPNQQPITDDKQLAPNFECLPAALRVERAGVAHRAERDTRRAADSQQAFGLIAFLTGAAFAVWTISISARISPFVLTVALWVASPYLVVTIATRWASSFVRTMILAGTLVATSSFGVWGFDKIDEDAQGALMLILAPA